MHKKKESGSSGSRRKGGDSAFHKPTTGAGPDVGEVKVEKKEPLNNNYYDRTPSNSSSGFSAFPSPYSPYNYPPSPYFYPGGYHTPLADPSSGREKEGKSGRASRETSDPGSSSKYYDLSRTSSQHYQPPKW